MPMSNPQLAPIPLLANNQVGAYTILASDYGKEVTFSGTFAVGITAAATLGAGWWCWIKNIGSGIITLTANGAELMRLPGGLLAGNNSITLPYSGSGEGPYNVVGGLLRCTGTGFDFLATNETHGSESFLANGNFVCPAGVVTVWLTGSGGGGTGGAGAVGGAGGGGSSGARCTRQPVTVVPGTTYAVTIGGSDAATSFGALLTLAGGNTGGVGGAGVSNGSGAQAPAGGVGGQSAIGNYANMHGGTGGLGGAGAFNTPGQAGPTNSGGGGAGGGGAGNNAGGAGGSGFLIVDW